MTFVRSGLPLRFVRPSGPRALKTINPAPSIDRRLHRLDDGGWTGQIRVHTHAGHLTRASRLQGHIDRPEERVVYPLCLRILQDFLATGDALPDATLAVRST